MPVLISVVEEISNPIDPLVRCYRRHQYRLCLSGFLAVPLWFGGYRKKPGHRRYDGQVRQSSNTARVFASNGYSHLEHVKFIMLDPQTRAVSLGIDVVQGRLLPWLILPPLFQLGHDTHQER
ncbi:hypothetical protein BKA70DRAFT_1562865 [Coprinopsis sp. MPI-PUGE-AT-0042]|nr:hypothetical protein BKA70DRAFT_1562865 [Coprinopsis sp. MPI-PUGE-AT-0042]